MEDKWAMTDVVDCCDDRVMGRETADMRLTAETQCQKTLLQKATRAAPVLRCVYAVRGSGKAPRLRRFPKGFPGVGMHKIRARAGRGSALAPKRVSSVQGNENASRLLRSPQKVFFAAHK